MTVRKKELANHPVAAAAAKTETAEMRAARKCMRELELENEFLKSPDLTLEPGPVDFWDMSRNLHAGSGMCRACRVLGFEACHKT